VGVTFCGPKSNQKAFRPVLRRWTCCALTAKTALTLDLGAACQQAKLKIALKINSLKDYRAVLRLKKAAAAFGDRF